MVGCIGRTSGRDGFFVFGEANRKKSHDANDADSGNHAIGDKGASAVAYATSYIANPDLVRRFQDGLPLAEVDQHSLYTPGAVGYSDYPDYTEV